MSEPKHKIPLILKLKRLKNSSQADSFNNFFSFLKPSKKFNGTPKKILLVRNDRIGDAVVTLPVIRNLKLNYPEIIIDLLVSKTNKFVIDNIDFVDEVIEFDKIPKDLDFKYRLPLIGSLLQFVKYILYPYILSADTRNELRYLMDKKYDAAIDLVGLKRNIILCKLVSAYVAGPRKFGVYLLYDYYLKTNWVTDKDSDFMTHKIEQIITESLNITLNEKNCELPIMQINSKTENEDYCFDLIFHIGTSELRKLPLEKEINLIEDFIDKKILIVDSSETNTFLNLKNYFKGKNNIEFKLFDSLKDISLVCITSKVLMCYDGGQAHYLSHFIRTLTIFGPGSVSLWKPYEFSEYHFLEKDDNGVIAIMSDGMYKHIAVYFPIWCRPCFDVGCKERLCIKNIRIEFINSLLLNYCLNIDK